MATVQALLHSASDLPSESWRRDAEILLCHCLGRNRAWLYAWPEGEVEAAAARRFADLVAARRAGKPIAHLTGRREFWSLDLEVTEHTLIPRTETESVVEWALELFLPDTAAVLDLGTGSGAIALALASERKQWQITALDRSEEALAVARRNARALGLSQVTFCRSDWYAAVAGQRFHLLVANPPYIAENDIHLQRGDLPYEPHGALVAPDGGLADLQTLVTGAPDFLHGGGYLLVEHGCDQGESVRQLLATARFTEVQTRPDLAGHERVSGGVLPS